MPAARRQPPARQLTWLAALLKVPAAGVAGLGWWLGGRPLPVALELPGATLAKEHDSITNSSQPITCGGKAASRARRPPASPLPCPPPASHAPALP
ncbi:MAG: hypothetical protein ACK583_11060 [Cyanobacteriota bacterium]